MELDNLPGLIIMGIGALRFRPLQILELNEFIFILGKLFGGFQFCPNCLRHPLPFRVRRRNDQGRLVLTDSRSVIRCQRLVPLVCIHFPQHSEFVQSLEGSIKIAAPQISNHGLMCVSLLPSDLGQFGRLQPGMLFQQPECVAPFNGPMLGGVTRKDDAAVFLFGEVNYARHRPNTQKPGLINPNHLAANL